MEFQLSNPAETTVKTAAPLPMVDHLRHQFESIHRQPELASDLQCFRAGEALSTVRYIAHAHSVHVARWLKILSHTRAKIDVFTANPIPAYSNELLAAIPVVPHWLRFPMVVRYVLAGLILRATRPYDPRSVIHAHGASGNGLVAWLSGQRYVIGTYGSEIFAAKERGSLYCWLLNRILHGAERMSVCSTDATRILVEQFGIPAERIYCFHLGYDDTNFRPVDRGERMQFRRDRNLPVDEPIWVVNRRTHPHYRTREVVDGFLAYCQQQAAGRLVLLCGDQQADYTQSIRDVLQSHPAGSRVTVVEQMLTAKELATWIQLGDYTISVPKTDNFSISTLESMGCGTVPILANLQAYRLLRPYPSIRWMDSFEPADFTDVFTETAASWQKHGDSQREPCHKFVQEGFSTEGAIRDMAAFYLGHPLRECSTEPVSRAA
jgi:glycosyltransferase involved in cell wall biosynthesis